jgi:hypothetical protein
MLNGNFKRLNSRITNDFGLKFVTFFADPLIHVERNFLLLDRAKDIQVMPFDKNQFMVIYELRYCN